MFQVLYRCAFREHWYDDIEPVADFTSAVMLARHVAAQRGTPAAVNDQNGRTLYRTDRGFLF
jgi:hypothetical protein